MVPNFDLNEFLAEFNRTSVASFVTNGRGSILEANQAAAEMFNVEKPTRMKNKSLVSYAPHKHTNGVRNMIGNLEDADEVNTDSFNMRPRGGKPFQATIHGRVVMRSNMIVLIHWEIKSLSATNSVSEPLSSVA